MDNRSLEHYDLLFDHITSDIFDYFEDEDIAISHNGFSAPDGWREYVFKITRKSREFLKQKESRITAHDFEEHVKQYQSHYAKSIYWNFTHLISHSLQVLSTQPRAIIEAQLHLISVDILRKRTDSQILSSSLSKEHFILESDYYLWCEMEGILLKKLARPIQQEDIEREEVEPIEKMPWTGTLEELNTVRNRLQEKGFITDIDNFSNHFSVNGVSESATSNDRSSPIIWQGTNTLLAYFIGQLKIKRKIRQYAHHWSLAEKHFNTNNNQPVKNLRQADRSNKDNLSQKPAHSEDIDAVLANL